MKICIRKLIALICVPGVVFSLALSVYAAPVPTVSSGPVNVAGTAAEKNAADSSRNLKGSDSSVSSEEAGDREDGNPSSFLQMVLVAVLAVLVLGAYGMLFSLNKKVKKMKETFRNQLQRYMPAYELSSRLDDIEHQIGRMNARMNRQSEEALLDDFKPKRSVNAAAENPISAIIDNNVRTEESPENQISNAVRTEEKPMTQYETFIMLHNKYLADEMSRKDFDREFTLTDFIAIRIDINREGSFHSSPQGQIIVYSQIYSDDSYQLAILNKEERSSFNNRQIRDSLEKMFDFADMQDFTSGKLICERPAKVVKRDGVYKVVSKGSYMI